MRFRTFRQILATILAATLASASGCGPLTEDVPQEEPESGTTDSADDAPDVETIDAPLTIDSQGRMFVADFEKAAQAQLKRTARNRGTFEKVLKMAFGEYDRAKGEGFRNSILRGDFSWMPITRLVSPEVLDDHEGAYAQSTNTVYINERLTLSPVRTLVYFEELGHFLDTQLRATDSPGDEGSIFRHLLVGTKIDKALLEALRRKQDHGSIQFDGQSIPVELFGWGSVKRFGKAVADVVVSAGKSVWDGTTYVWGKVSSAGDALGKLANQAWEGATVLGGWIGKGLPLCQRE